MRDLQDAQNALRTVFCKYLYEPNTDAVRESLYEEIRVVYSDFGFDPDSIAIDGCRDSLKVSFIPKTPDEYEALSGKSVQQAIIEDMSAGDTERADGLRRLLTGDYTDKPRTITMGVTFESV